MLLFRAGQWVIRPALRGPPIGVRSMPGSFSSIALSKGLLVGDYRWRRFPSLAAVTEPSLNERRHSAATKLPECALSYGHVSATVPGKDVIATTGARTLGNADNRC
jgi:hypothetical protein